MDLDVAARELGLRLDLGDLGARNLCHGYSHACVCAECRARAKQVAPEFLEWLDREDETKTVPALWRPAEHAPQPWESKAA